MASAASLYDERLRLVDSFEEYKYYFSKAHFLFLVQESLELTQGGPEKLKYILGLASRCKTGVVSIELLAKQIDKEYSLPHPLLQEEKAGVEEGRAEEWVDMDTDIGEADAQEDEDEGEEQEAPHVSQEVEHILTRFKSGFFKRNLWRPCNPFVAPGEGYWLAAHPVQRLRTSTYDDFASATPMPMPVFIDGNPWTRFVTRGALKAQEKSYRLCRKVAVSLDGKIYRATDAEIEAALRSDASAPSTDADTYLQAVKEVRRRHAIAKALLSGSG